MRTMLLLSLSVSCWADPLDDGLAKAGLTRGSLRFDPAFETILNEDKYILGYFRACYQNPLRTPTYLADTRESLVKSQQKGLAELLIRTMGVTGVWVLRGFYQDEPYATWQAKAEDANAVEDALREVIEATGGRSFLRGLPDGSELPGELRGPTSVLLRAIASGVRWRERAFRHLSAGEVAELREPAMGWATDSESGRRILDTIERVDYACLYSGAVDIARGIDYFLANVKPPSRPFRLRVKTKMGWIEVSNVQSDAASREPKSPGYSGRFDRAHRHTGPFLLMVSFSGDDLYVFEPAPVSVTLDLAGSDIYRGKQGSLASGIFGYGFVVDTEGDDAYECEEAGEGSGIFGVGMLADFVGDDSYEAVCSSQGSGQFGVGVLLDRRGSDRYFCYTDSQGYGFTKGCGLLLDLEGNDRYVANTTDIRYPSAQDPKHNVSMAQGAGCGLRDDYITGHSLAGGIGLLIDEAGDDSYTGDVFCQGTGYWYALGALLDRDGNDSYTGFWYHCGNCAHSGIGVVMDDKGDDRYTSTGPSSLAFGHDVGLGLVIDGAGNDTYRSSIMGVGNVNGFGIFVDAAGDDKYLQGALGRARTDASGRGREFMPTLGLFLDLGGNDTYPGDLKNNSEKVTGNDNANFRAPAARGVFLDLEYTGQLLWWQETAGQ